MFRRRPPRYTRKRCSCRRPEFNAPPMRVSWFGGWMSLDAARRSRIAHHMCDRVSYATLGWRLRGRWTFDASPADHSMPQPGPRVAPGQSALGARPLVKNVGSHHGCSTDARIGWIRSGSGPSLRRVAINRLRWEVVERESGAVRGFRFPNRVRSLCQHQAGGNRYRSSRSGGLDRRRGRDPLHDGREVAFVQRLALQQVAGRFFQ